MEHQKIELKGRVLIRFEIEAVTGLHIGGSDSGIEIGGVDKTVVRDPLTNRPYVPGSSLKGKMRSLLEKYRGLRQNQRIGTGYIHSCGADLRRDELTTRGKAEYQKCDICQVFGAPGERDFSTPTRLVVRDVALSDESAARLEKAHTDLPFTEVKTEVSIDRVTSAANPRQMERVPAGAVFGDAELVYSVYSGSECDPREDVKRLKTVVEGLRLMEDDYLGGSGSRGSGKVRLRNIRLSVRGGADYLRAERPLGNFAGLDELASGFADLLTQTGRELGL